MKIAVLGGGQLAQMLAMAGAQENHEFMFLSEDPDACAAPYGQILLAPLEDFEAQERLAAWADVVTYEFESLALDAVRRIETLNTLRPSASALGVASDRLIEKRLFRELGIPTTEFFPVENLAQLEEGFSKTSKDAILKTRTQGYDGKGQASINKATQLVEAWNKVGKVPSILEQKVQFSRELSIIAARSVAGDIAYYPASENIHREGILRFSIARINDPFQSRAESLIKRIMEKLDYVGVLALELFQVEGELFANEIAPRVHNTGHWTIEGASTSQFANHLRAVCGSELGSTDAKQLSAMVNLIGKLPPAEAIATIPNATLHAYGKAERPGRKVGHISLINNDPTARDSFHESLRDLLRIAGEDDLASKLSW